MNKPVFLLWAHREMWGILSDNPTWNKDKALRLLVRRYPKKLKGCFITCGCFACNSRKILYSRGTDWRMCPTHCPLDWDKNKDWKHIDCVNPNSPYGNWSRAKVEQRWADAAKYAAIIKNLPLSPIAEQLYDIRRTAND